MISQLATSQSQPLIKDFAARGFVIFSDSVMSAETLTALRSELERVLLGKSGGVYDSHAVPTKAPRRSLVLAFQPYFDTLQVPGRSQVESLFKAAPSGQPAKTLQMINIHNASLLFRQLATCTSIGQAVCAFMGWSGARFCQDQVWIKPPCSGPLAFHRDSTYFDFEPKGEVCTVWLSLDDLQGDEGCSLGPLEYCVGSHLWGDGRRGSAGQFFDSNHRKLLVDAAAREGLSPHQLEFDLVRAAAGGLSIHHGRCWHGSGANVSSTRVRRGVGMHYIPSSARWPESPVGKLWRDAAMASGAGDRSLSDEIFPIIWGS